MLNWGIIGTGGIAHRVAKVLTPRGTQGYARACAVCSRTEAAGAAFAREFGIDRVYTDIDALLADPEISAVYIATPHPFHCAAALRAANAKKHILCEKTLAMDAAQARAMANAARENGVLLVEAFTFRVSEQAQKMRALLADGAVGEPLHAACDFFFTSEKTPARLTEKALGGGAMLDLGCYALALVRMAMGACAGAAFLNPRIAAGAAQWLPTGADRIVSAFARFENGATAALACGFQGCPTQRFSLVGTRGRLDADAPFFEKCTLRLSRNGKDKPEIFECGKKTPDRFGRLFARIGACVEAGETALPEMTPEDSVGNVAALDDWRAAVGLTYP